jgi:YVTN family beta-propeller protein
MKNQRRGCPRLSGLCTAVAVCRVLVACPVSAADAPRWLGPQTLAASPDGTRLMIACSDARRILAVDVATGKVTASIEVPAEPTGLVFDWTGERLYVTCAAPQSTVCAIDAGERIVARFAAGHTAIAPVVSPDGTRLYVCNRFDNDISVIELPSGKVLRRVAAVREPCAAAITRSGKTLFVANQLPNDRVDSYDVAAIITAVDTASGVASSIRLLNGSTSVRGITVSPDGKFAYVAHILARYQIPTTQLERGWMNTNALSIIDAEKEKLVTVILLDDVDLGAAAPWGVAATTDGQTVCVAHAGTHELSVIDIPRVMEKLASITAPRPAGTAAAPGERSMYASTTPTDVPNDLAFLVELRQRVPLSGAGPRGVAVIGSRAYVAQYFSDSLAVVDVSPKAAKRVTTIALGPAPKVTEERRGEMLFNDANICFQHWQSCATCHPDARIDALNWDLTNDGLGNPKNTKSLLVSHNTPPAMWTGVRKTGEAGVRSGITHILLSVRPEEEAVAIDQYLKVLQPVPSPHLVGGQLSAKAQRGKALFFNEKVGCAKCHPEPYYTDLRMHDVNSEGPYDRRSTFDTPGLQECWRTAPYLHDGHYLTVKELLTTGKHVDHDGHLGKLTSEQIDDLVEFVLSL